MGTSSRGSCWNGQPETDPDPALPQGAESQRGKREGEEHPGFPLKLMLRSAMAKPRELQSTGVILNAPMAVSYSEGDRSFIYFQKSRGFCFRDGQVVEETPNDACPEEQELKGERGPLRLGAGKRKGINLLFSMAISG